MDYQKILEDIYMEIQLYAGKGAQADYIPALAKVNPDQFGIALRTVSGDSYEYEKAQTRFSIPSISKVFESIILKTIRFLLTDLVTFSVRSQICIG